MPNFIVVVVRAVKTDRHSSLFSFSLTLSLVERILLHLFLSARFFQEKEQCLPHVETFHSTQTGHNRTGASPQKPPTKKKVRHPTAGLSHFLLFSSSLLFFIFPFLSLSPSSFSSSSSSFFCGGRRSGLYYYYQAVFVWLPLRSIPPPPPPLRIITPLRLHRSTSK